MSRIDEALRRAGSESGAPSRMDRDPAFVSPWNVDAGQPDATREVCEDEKVSALSQPILTTDRSSAISFSSKWRERHASGPDADQHLVEQFRRLAATLHHAQAASGLRTVMVTSASANDGKTFSAVNLALVLSESYGRNVLLIDADLRHPSIGDLADVTSSIGLSEALKAKTEQKLAVIELTPHLTLLPAGRPDPDPLSGLTSPRMKRILDEAAARFDWVILDAPPVGPVADTNLLGAMVDGALFVVSAGRTQYPLVQKAIETLGRERILGVILNRIQQVPDLYEYHGDRQDHKG